MEREEEGVDRPLYALAGRRPELKRADVSPYIYAVSHSLSG